MNKDPRPLAEELKRLTEQLFAMAGLAERRLQTVLRSLVNRSSDPLAEVIAGDSDIDDLQIEIDSSCFRLLALHQPVAVDLRTIVSVLKINADLERVGDLAVNIAEDVIFIVEARDVRHRSGGLSPIERRRGGGAALV